MPLFAQEASPDTPKNPEEVVEFTEEDFQAVLEQMTPEEMEQLVEAAAKRSLEVERQQVAGEIRENLLYDETAVKKALEILNAPAESPSRQDNIERICRAYAAVDEAFAEAYRLYREKQFPEAAKRLRHSLNPEDASYFSAAVHCLAADCLIREEKLWPGVEIYSDLLVNLPDRISFATEGALRAAKIYEHMGRNLYAMQMYAYCLSNYALTMDKKEMTSVADRYEELAAVYRDPMNSLTGMLAHIHDRLTRKDVGEGTRQRQQEVVALLEDLIQTHEEKQRPDKNAKRQPKPCRSKAGEEKKKPRGEGSCKKPGRPSGTPRNPTVGAKESVLVPGPVSRPNKLANIHAGNDADAWSDLPPRQKEAIRNLMRRRLTERRGEMVRDYHRKLAEGE
ncbi:MAG: hypothetical protein JXA11_16500 [Phycisphaerae bacterium]|nr:hypothetical protein [Phycisphaerae bacterium]